MPGVWGAVHDGAAAPTTRPRDLPQGEEPLVVRWHKRQFTYREVPCPRKAFTEQIAELPAGARVTGRLRRHVAGRVADGLASERRRERSAQLAD